MCVVICGRSSFTTFSLQGAAGGCRRVFFLVVPVNYVTSSNTMLHGSSLGLCWCEFVTPIVYQWMYIIGVDYIYIYISISDITCWYLTWIYIYSFELVCCSCWFAQKQCCSTPFWFIQGIMNLNLNQGVSKQWSCETLAGGDRWQQQQGQPKTSPPNPVVSCLKMHQSIHIFVIIFCFEIKFKT